MRTSATAVFFVFHSRSLSAACGAGSTADGLMRASAAAVLFILHPLAFILSLAWPRWPGRVSP